MLFPYRIDTLFKHYPYANWAIMAVTVLCFGLLSGGVFSDDLVDAMVLDGWNPVGLVGHALLHAGFLHLIGNMVFLWVFGNAVCGNTSNTVYPFAYVAFALAAAATHLVFDGGPAVGASGAINGVVGMALAMYPLNRVSVFWLFWFKVGTFEMPLWGLAVVWLVFDIFGAVGGAGLVAYWAHLGGFFAGLAAGYLSLRKGWVTLTKYDHRSLEEIFTGRTADERRERIVMAEAEDDRSEAMLDPLVMTATATQVARWTRAAQAQSVSAADAATIQAGGDAGERKNFELLYGRSFLALGFSFHRSLADYYRKMAEGKLQPHETRALANLLRMVEEDFAAMRRVGFVNEELAELRDETRLAAFFSFRGTVSSLDRARLRRLS